MHARHVLTKTLAVFLHIQQPPRSRFSMETLGNCLQFTVPICLWALIYLHIYIYMIQCLVATSTRQCMEPQESYIHAYIFIYIEHICIYTWNSKQPIPNGWKWSLFSTTYSHIKFISKKNKTPTIWKRWGNFGYQLMGMTWMVSNELVDNHQFPIIIQNSWLKPSVDEKNLVDNWGGVQGEGITEEP